MINELEASQSTPLGLGFFLVCVLIFIANFLLSRSLTISLIREGFIKNKSEEFQKCIIAWFFPIVGVISLLMLLTTHLFIRTTKKLNQKLFLSHIK